MNMVELGDLALRLSLPVTVFALIIAITGLMKNGKRSAESTRRFSYLNFILHLFAFVGLGIAFLRDRFDVLYVYNHSSQHMPDVYKFSAIWGGMEGSLLLWGFVLSVFIAMFAFTKRNDEPKDKPGYYCGTFIALYITQLFFLILLNVTSFPFEPVPTGGTPADGSGLNPILQNPGMAIHPPLLYLGFVGLTLPYSFGIGAMLSGKLDDFWLKEARVWSMIGWTILALGIARGGLWAYQQLGWGGYWAWDPVENSSFMPWLLVTAFLHSAIIQKQRGMLKIWNMVLVVLMFAATIFGTFLTRSGVITSVHTFARNMALGSIFLSFLGIVLFGGIGLMIWRRKALQAQHKIKSFFSREFMFVLNNFILVGITAVILYGTLLPTLTEYFTGERRTVGEPYFNFITVPLFILLTLLIGIGTLIAWRKTTKKNLIRKFTLPTIGSLVTVPLFIWLTSTGMNFAQFKNSIVGPTLSQIYCVLSYTTVVFVAIATFQEYYEGVATRIRKFGEGLFTAFYRMFTSNQARYGGYLVHLGVLIVVVGITTNNAFKQERKFAVQEARTFTFANHEMTFTGYEQFWAPSKEQRNASVIQANLEVKRSKNEQNSFDMHPQIKEYRTPEQITTQIALDIQWFGDLYVVLNEIKPKEQLGVFTMYWNPFVLLIWIGVGVMGLGGLLAILPLPRSESSS